MTLYSSGGVGGYRAPSNITALHQQDTNQEIILAANPWLAGDLETLNTLAQSGADPEQLAHNAGALAGVEAVDRLQVSLERLNPVAARSVYGRLTEQQQRGLQTLGYQPPNQNKDGFLDNTILEGAFDVTANVVSAVARPVGTVVAPVAGLAMDLLTWVGDVPAHFYRAIRQMEGWQQWLALAAAAGAVGLTGGLALGAIGAGTALGGAAAGMMGGAGALGTLTTMGALGGIGLGAATLSTIPSALQNPTEWWDMMNPFGATGVTRGERIFSKQAQIKARSILGNAEHLDALARDISAELDVTDLAFDLAGVRDATNIGVMQQGIEATARKMADPGTPEYQAIFDGLNTLMMQDEFKQAVDELAGSKISIGRDVASAFQLEAGDRGYGFISGAVDGMWLLAMDPTMALGKIGKLQRMARRGLETPSGPDAIQRITKMVNEDAMVSSTVNQVTSAVMNGKFSEMPRAWRSMYQPLMEYRHGEYLQHGLPKLEEFGPKEFLEFIAHGDGLKRITEGKATIRGIEQIVLSGHNSTKGWGKFVNELKQAKYAIGDEVMIDDARRLAKKMGVEADFEKTLPSNFANEGIDTGFVVRSMDEPAIAPTWGYNAGSAIGKGLLYTPGGRTLGNFITGITTMIPPNSAIALTGEESVEHIPRFVESMGTHFNMPSGFRNEWLDTIMSQGTVGQRRQALYSYMDSVLTAGGMRNTDELQGFADEFIHKYKQAYGAGGADHIRVGNYDEINRIVGVLPDHHGAVYMVMPNLREMSKVVRTGHFLKNVAKVTDHNWHEQVMARVVKPGWLLRIGFIPRAAGEEMLAFFMRMSEGGLLQEFSGRAVGQFNEHKKALKRLEEVGGARELLSRDELRALDPSVYLPGHMKPLARMKSALGNETPDQGMLGEWLEATSRWREQGIVPALLRQDRESLPGWLTEGDWRRALVVGKTGSIREMALMGVDPDYVRAGELWMNKHADGIMRATSSLNAGMMEKQLINPDTMTMTLPDPKNPSKSKETLVVMNGERGRVAASDPRYRNAVHHRVNEVFHDEVVRPIYSAALTNYFPGFDEIDLSNVADALESISVADGWTAKTLVGEFLQPRADTWSAAATTVGHNQPELAEAMRIAAQNADGGTPTVADFQQTLRETAARLHVEDVDPKTIAIIEKLDTELEQMRAVLEGMEALGPDARAWTSAVLTRQMASDHQAYNLRNVRRQAGGEAFNNQPSLVYYRGIRDTTNTRINADGSITFFGTEQTQWGGAQADAISLSTDPGQSLQYATARSGSSSARLDGGVVIEIDGNYVNNQFNTTLDEVRSNPNTYGDIRFEGDGLYMLGSTESGEYTEIAVGLAGNPRTAGFIGPEMQPPRELTIPAGHWRPQNVDDMRHVSDMARTGNPKWADVSGNVVFDIKGEPIQNLFPATDAALDDFLGKLTDEEKTLLNRLFNEQADEFTAWQNNAFANQLETGVADNAPVKPEPAFSIDSFPTGGEDAESIILDSLIVKWRAMVDGTAGGKATHGDVLHALQMDQMGATTQNAYALDDLIRERLGTPLMQNLDKLRGKNVLDDFHSKSAANQMLTQGFDMRSTGGWGGMDEVEGWAPFATDVNQMMDTVKNDLAAALVRPENVHHVKRSDRILTDRDGNTVARPVADGEARIYTPVVPPRSQHIDEILDGPELEQMADIDLVTVRGIESALATGDGIVPNQGVTGNEWAAQQAAWLVTDDATAAWEADRLGQAVTEQQRAAWRLHERGWTVVDDDPARVVYRQTDEFPVLWEQYIRHIQVPQTFETRAAKLLGQHRAWHYEDDLIRSLTEEQKVDIISRALRHYDASRGKYGQEISSSMSELAFDDPRIAKWISSLFAGEADQGARVGMIAVPRLAVGGDVSNKFGVALADDLGDAGRRWNLDARYNAQAKALDADMFQAMDSGEIVPGMSQAAVIKEWADDIVESVVTNHRRGVREGQVYNRRGSSERLARKVGDTYEPLVPGERMDGPEDLFRLDGNDRVGDAVDFGDNAFFDHVITEQSDDLMWATVGPMLRDVFESEAGLTRTIPNNFHEGGKFWGKKPKAGDPQTATEFINMRRSRVSDLNLEPSQALPNVAITENFRRVPNTTWDRIVRYGFDSVIGPAIDGLARKPMSFHYFASAYKQQKKHLAWQLDDDLFGRAIPEQFSEMIGLARSQGQLSEEMIADAKLVARNFGTDLTDAGANDVKRFLMTLGNDQEGFEQAMRLSIQARKNSMAYAGAGNADAADEAFVVAAESLLENVNQKAFMLTIEDEVVGMRTDAERLVQAYHDAVPDGVWESGKKEVLRYVEKHADGLAFNLTDDQFVALRNARTNLKHINDQAADVAALRAMENVIPFLDSHEQRTMFGEYGRNFLPFWYAEENFIKRWARTLSLGEFATPFKNLSIPSGGLDAMRKAQLTYMGIKSAGIIRTDANGHDWIVYPGSGLLQEAIAKLPGMGDLLPVGVLFQAETDSLLPGVTPDGNVSPAPLVGLPFKYVSAIFPDADNDLQRAVVGDIGASRSAVSQFVPSVLNNMWQAFFQDENSSTRYASAMNSAIAFMEAAGKGIAENAGAVEIDAYLDRVRNHARIVMASQAIAGFFVPGSPNALITGETQLLGTGANTVDPREVTNELYRSYIRNLGMDKGVEAFLEAFPDADLEDIVDPLAYSTSGSTIPSAAPLVATSMGVDWYNRNKDWVDSSPEAGAWLIPQPDAKEDVDFNRNAYSAQVVSGLRKRRTPQEYISAIKYRAGAAEYFDVKDQYDAAIMRAGGDMDRKRQIDDIWGLWKSNYLAANPLFAEQLQNGDARVRRGRTIDQMRYAITDPQAPDSPYQEPISRLSASYDTYAAQRKKLGDRNDAKSREDLRLLKEAFSNWGTAWALDNPSLARLWDSVYRIEAGIA